MSIPVVDISAYGLQVADPAQADKAEIQKLADEFCNALSTVGFCYLKNHGISSEQIDAVQQCSQEFFTKEISYKERFAKTTDKNHGWVSLGRERLNPDRPAADYKEAFNYTPTDEIDNWPDQVPQFEKTVKELFASCDKLALRLFDLMSWGLHLKDKSFLSTRHQRIGKTGNSTTVRCLFYPPPPEGKELLPGQIQCGEHSDYGTLTMLFQDNTGGLQVKNMHGDYIDATPMEDTIIINIGDLMQRWTADKLIATKHRVIFPKDVSDRRASRQSIAFFVQPDDAVMVECLDGSNKYAAVNSKDYLWAKFGKSYV